MNTILIIGVVQGIFLALLILTKKKKNISDYLLSLNFLIFATTTFLSFMELYNRQNGYPYPAFLNSSPTMIFLHGPAIWFYVKSLTTKNFKFSKIDILHLIPFFIVSILLFSGHFLYPVETRIEIDINQSFKERLIYPVVIAGIAVSSLSYIFIAIWRVKKYKDEIKSYFSEISGIGLDWLKFLLYSAVVLYAFNSLTYTLDYIWQLMPYSFMQSLAHAMASLFVLTLAFFGLRQENVFISMPVKMNLDKRQQSPSLNMSTNSKDSTFINDLLHYMQQNKPHLDQCITIAGLSGQLNTSPEYLSSILNVQLNKSFFDFINHYRIKEFKQKCKDPQNKDYTLISIALDCGFSSKATFNRVFKNMTGYTPSQYLQQVSKN
ncbi:helix-turn-helix domain-containing protein [Alkalitalea saponilacus]|uniref:AraC-type DNA-binding protein n=1 Tax=Alkalitalea saponilacus TaxID=889453 RepID=A0A1T5HSY7_9BACT|nr:AraC family transcriptional regulator [Alkalitalea saponilacus]ASB47705.1 hypothetical protein CDL62_00310 [Alkalitalea saponilacus]SKC23631.1 AraC-type DNA-binding protein [Alkalitalea saponilacus]